jgi:hypothetical protein
MRANFAQAASRFFLKSIHGWLTVLCLLLVSTTVDAHQTGNSYLNIHQVDGRIAVDLDFFVRDLGSLLQSPGGADEPAPAPDKLRELQRPITDAIQRLLKIEIDNRHVALDFLSQSVVLHNDGIYVRQQFLGPELSSELRFVVIRYEFFTQNDRLGRAFLRLKLQGDEISSVFDRTNSIQRFVLGEIKRSATILLFTKEGAKHIWSGSDHLIFLLTLLLPGLMLWNKNASGLSDTRSKPRTANRDAIKFALKVITAFTLAHSITLALSVFGLVSLPERLVESMIALSIIASALLNLQSRFLFSHWKLAFFFGLIHGLGFANGLKELGLSSLYFLETLVAFNVGVELGQLSVVIIVAIPILLLVRSDKGKQRILTSGSFAVLCISVVWLFQRLLA